MRVERLDHLVLTVTDLEATLGFYTNVCGMTPVSEQDQTALRFGDQLIKLQVWGSEIEPRAKLSTPGSADLCFVVDMAANDVVAQLEEVGVAVVAGPVQRNGVHGVVTSVYCRDPDGNLVELASYVDGAAETQQADNTEATEESTAADGEVSDAETPETDAVDAPVDDAENVDANNAKPATPTDADPTASESGIVEASNGAAVDPAAATVLIAAPAVVDNSHESVDEVAHTR